MAETKKKGRKAVAKKVYKFPSEGAIDKAQVGLRVGLELLQKVIETYGKAGENTVQIVIRALEKSVEGVELSSRGKKIVEEQMQNNYEKRMKKRLEVWKNPMITS